MVPKTIVWIPVILFTAMLIFGLSAGVENDEKGEATNTEGDDAGGSDGDEGNNENQGNGTSSKEDEREDGTINNGSDTSNGGGNGTGDVDDAENRKDDDNLTEKNASIEGMNITVKARTNRNIIIEEITTERYNEIIHDGVGLADGDADYMPDGDTGGEKKREPRGFGVMFNVSIGDGEVSDIHLDIDIGGRIPSDVDEGMIRLYWLDEEHGKWEKIENSSYDPKTGYLSADIDHLTIFAPMEEPSEKKGAASDENSLAVIIVVIATVMAVLLVIFLAMKRKISRDGEGKEEEEEAEEEDAGNEETDDEKWDDSSTR